MIRSENAKYFADRATGFLRRIPVAFSFGTLAENPWDFNTTCTVVEQVVSFLFIMRFAASTPSNSG